MNHPNACIYFYHKGLIKYTGVMLKGKMEVLADQKTKGYYCDLKTESFTIE